MGKFRRRHQLACIPVNWANRRRPDGLACAVMISLPPGVTPGLSPWSAIGELCHEALFGMDDVCPWCSVEAIRRGEDRQIFKEIMLDIGLDCARSDVAHSLEEAVRTSEEIGYPVVMKVVSRDILHKSDGGRE